MSKKVTIKTPPQKTPVAFASDLTTRSKGLDSLRGIFAMLVFFSHAELMKYYAGLDSFMYMDIVHQSGRIGVTGFFVLSGFLITIHLLQQRDSEGSVVKKIKVFYTKRILRIWPLYYAIILLSLYAFPHINALHFTLPNNIADARLQLSQYQWYYLFLLPQVPLSYHVVLPFAEPSWSIGVEELFYLIIPLVIFSTKRLQPVLIAVCLLFIGWRYISFYTSDNTIDDFGFNLLIVSRYDCISIGCLAGLYYYQKRDFLKFINTTVFVGCIIALILFSAVASQSLYQYAHFSILFAVIILYTAANNPRIFNSKLLQFYGKVSFSLYMVHEIAIMLLLNAHDFSDYHPVLFYIVSFTFATLLAFISFKVIEEPFLKIKSKVR
jgi:peptidoglycan/LPS O-acetylase OafA/YrhL